MATPPAPPLDPAALPAPLLLAAGRVRARGRLDLPPGLPAADPPVVAVRAALPAAGAWLGGGEPTLRPDLPQLLEAVGPDAWLATDGLLLATAGVAAQLHGRGLRRVRIPLHAARPDAHDWLVDQPGAAKRVVRGIRAAVEAGIAVEVEVVLTRPTMDLLSETVAAAARLGATGVVLRRVEARGAAARDFIALSPRLGLLQPLVERAVRAARQAGLEVAVRGLPRCALGSEGDALAAPSAVLAPTAELAAVAAALAPPAAAAGCSVCPGPPGCPGAPADYVARFGRAELEDRCSLPPAGGLPVATGEGPPGTPPPPRMGRAPATRLAFAVRQAARGALAGDPLRGVPGVSQPAVVRARFPPAQATRALRQELCRLAQVGAGTLQVDDPESLRHPRLGELLRECVRLGFQRVELRGPVDGLALLSDRELVGLRGLSLVEAEPGPDGDEAARATLDRLQRLARCEVRLLPWADRPTR